MTDQLTVLEQGPVVQVRENQQTNPYSILQLAIERGASIEQLEKLMALQERHEANEARKAYVVAMSEFKKNPPRIEKDSTVAYNGTKYNHASLANVTEKINSALASHGLSASWKTTQSERITVTCCITHILGHTVCTSLSAPADTSGSKNAIQAIGSTISYLERYTMLALTGLSTHEQDNDGQSLNVPTIDEKQQSQIIDMMLSKNVNESQFLAWLKVDSVENIPADKFGYVMKTLENVKVNS